MQDAKQLLHQPAENTRQLLKNTLGMACAALSRTPTQRQ